jgi:CHRD domain
MSFADRTSGPAAADAPHLRGPRSSSRRVGLRVGVAAVASGALAVGALALVPSAGASARRHNSHSDSSHSTAFSFTTLNNNADPTFNQLLGINDDGVIAGYLGSGAAGHPNQGYQLQPPHGQADYVSENFPGSVQTQVTGLNNHGVTVGFFSGQNNQNLMNDNFGFYNVDGRFHEVNFPTNDNATPPVDQLLGINDDGVAVGFFVNALGNNRGYAFDTKTGKFTRVLVPGAPRGAKVGPSLTAAAINDSGDIAGFFATAGGATNGFVKDGQHFTDLAFPGASATMALGINGDGEVAGTYTMGTGSAAVMHGFTWTGSHGFSSLDDPNGVGSTTVNGINDRGDLVGFYTDTAGNTDGFLATPAERMVRHLDLMPMPAGTVSLSQNSMGQNGMGQNGMGQNSMGQLTAQLSTIGLTPGSSHTVQLLGPNGTMALAQFGMLTASATGQGDATLSSTFTGSIPDGSRLVILNGSQGGNVGSELIAETSELSGNAIGRPLRLKAIEVTAGGANLGTPEGRASIRYDPGARTLTVTVNASGLTAGMHAAHIHLGSCASQGAVQFMMMDLVANGQGKIVNQTRVISGVTTGIPASGWYLNIHQGNSNTILQNGQPTIDFRPLLCSDI